MSKPLLDDVADATIAIGKRVDDLENPPKDPRRAVVDAGLPADFFGAEENVWRRYSPAKNRWREVAEFDARAGELEQRQAAINAELQELYDRERAAPDADAAALAEWELHDRKGQRPEPTLPAIQAEIKELQASWDALVVAVGRVAADKERVRRQAPWPAGQGRRPAHRRHARVRYLELVDQLEAAREDLRGRGAPPSGPGCIRARRPVPSPRTRWPADASGPSRRWA